MERMQSDFSKFNKSESDINYSKISIEDALDVLNYEKAAKRINDEYNKKIKDNPEASFADVGIEYIKKSLQGSELYGIGNKRKELESKVNDIIHFCAINLSAGEILTPDFINRGSSKKEEHLDDNAKKRKPIIEISKSTDEEIKNQEQGIKDLVEYYRKDYLEALLKPMWDSYLKEENPRLKELLKTDFAKAKESSLMEIDRDLENIPESEYFDIAGARAEMMQALKEEIMKFGEDDKKKEDSPSELAA